MKKRCQSCGQPWGYWLVWQIAAMLLNKDILPAPTTVFMAFFTDIGGELGGHFLSLSLACVGITDTFDCTGSPGRVGTRTIQKTEPDFLPYHLPALPDPEGRAGSHRHALSWDQRPLQDRDDISHPVLPDPGAGARPGSLHPPGIGVFGSQPGSRPARFVPFCVPSGQPASHPHRGQAEHWHGCGGAVYCRVNRHHPGLGLLHLFAWHHPVRLSQDVCRRGGDEPVGIGLVFRSRLAAPHPVPLAIPGRKRVRMIPSDPQERLDQVRGMFARIAGRYDTLNRVMTFGRDRAWRSEAIQRLEAKPGQVILDAGSGTGDIALEIKAKEPTVNSNRCRPDA